MSGSQAISIVDTKNNNAVVLAPSGLQCCEITQKPPERSDYGNDAEYEAAVANHYNTYPEGWVAPRRSTISQTGLNVGNMAVNNIGVTFTDGTVQVTAGGGGGTTLTPVSGNNATQSDVVVGKISNSLTSSSENYGIDTGSVMPGPNGSGNGLPEQCNSMMFLTLNADLRSIGLGASVPCYVPCYFRNTTVISPELQFSLNNGAFSTLSPAIELFEGNWGLGPAEPIQSEVLYPTSASVTIRVSPPPSDNSSIILNLDTTRYPSNRIGFTNYTSFTTLNATNGYQVTWIFTIEDNLTRDLTELGWINITTTGSNVSYIGLTGRVNFGLYDYQDSLIIRKLWEDAYISINGPEKANSAIYYENLNGVNSATFTLIVEYVEYGETGTDVIAPHPIELNFSQKERDLVDAWRTNTPLSQYNQTASGINLTTKQAVFSNVYINTSNQIVNADGLYDLQIKMIPDANNIDDGDDTNNLAYPMLFILHNASGTTVHNTGEGSPNADPLYQFSGDPNYSTYTSTTFAHPGMQLQTWFLFGDLINAATGLPEDGGGDGGGGGDDGGGGGGGGGGEITEETINLE